MPFTVSWGLTIATEQKCFYSWLNVCCKENNCSVRAPYLSCRMTFLPWWPPLSPPPASASPVSGPGGGVSAGGGELLAAGGCCMEIPVVSLGCTLSFLMTLSCTGAGAALAALLSSGLNRVTLFGEMGSSSDELQSAKRLFKNMKLLRRLIRNWQSWQQIYCVLLPNPHHNHGVAIRHKCSPCAVQQVTLFCVFLHNIFGVGYLE